MTWVPQACTLATGEQPSRVAAFDELFATAVRAAERPEPTRLRLYLAPGEATASAVRELIADEAGCCSFFAFDLRESAAAAELDVRVPDRHVAVLDAMHRRAESTRAGRADG